MTPTILSAGEHVFGKKRYRAGRKVRRSTRGVSPALLRIGREQRRAGSAADEPARPW
jgi:hypothetical protein